VRIAFQLDWRGPPAVGHPPGPFAEAVTWVEHLAIAADCRIDNRDELVAQLRLAPAASGPEIVARAYLAWGEDFPARLSGDFAIVLWDARQARLLVARDPFGVRPLFFAAQSQTISISSSVESLLRVVGGPPRLDEVRPIEYLLDRYASSDATFFREIREVPAGHLVVMSRAGRESRRYWRPIAATEVSGVGAAKAGEYAEEHARLFIQAVRRRLVSQGPVAIHVSGGLDSTAIACAADVVHCSGGAPAPAIVGVAGLYPGLSCDESPFIGAVERHVSFPIESWDETLSDGADLTEPFQGEPGIRATFRGGTIGDLTIARAHGGTVILSGVGGDQLGMVDGVVKDLLSGGAWRAAFAEMLMFPGATMATRAGRLRHVLKQFEPTGMTRWRFRLRPRLPTWLTPRAASIARDIVASVRPSEPSLSQVQRGVWGRLTSAQMARNVAMLSAHAQHHDLEYRFPFLDRELVRFTLSIPVEGWPKPRPFARLHRESLRPILPKEIADRAGKAEFTPALAHRFDRSRALVEQLFASKTWASADYVDRHEAQRLWRALTAERATGASRSTDFRQLWALLTLEAWLRKLFGYDVPGSTQGDMR
jgi:asparagine synthase (glutamine-hydrolysing)